MTHAFDKRTVDNNGHLHVPNCRITKASVDDYLGAETADSHQHGFGTLDKIAIYRDAQELEKAVATFEAVPLMAEHILSTAGAPQKQLIVGAVTNPRWEAPYIVADLTLWDQVGIDLIESKEQADLSCGYARELDWNAGVTPEGLQYKARMFNIKCNHVALVSSGRVPGAVVADKAPEVSMFDKLKFPKLVAALLAAIGGEKKAETALALDAALESEVALDAKKKHSKDDKKHAKDDDDKSMDDDDKSMDDDDKSMDDDDDSYDSEEEHEEKKDKKKFRKEREQKAFDAAVKEALEPAVKAAVEVAVKDAETKIHNLYAARGAVAPVVGDVSLDSAEAVYRFALDKAGVDHKAVAADKLAALWESNQSKSGSSMDAASTEPFDINSLFSGLGFIRKG